MKSVSKDEKARFLEQFTRVTCSYPADAFHIHPKLSGASKVLAETAVEADLLQAGRLRLSCQSGAQALDRVPAPHQSRLLPVSLHAIRLV